MKALKQAVLSMVLVLASPLTATGADGSCAGGAPPVGRIVAADGSVRIGARTVASGVAVCAGETVTVGTRSRASVMLIAADTVLRLDEGTVTQLEQPPAPNSGMVRLLRGAVYFLSQVRRSLTIETPYLNAGIDGTEVLLRVDDSGRRAGAELLVLDGQVQVKPGPRNPSADIGRMLVTGEELRVEAGGAVQWTGTQSREGEPIRRMARSRLAWTLYYPTIVDTEAAPYPRIAEAQRLLDVGRAAEADSLLRTIGETGVEGGLAAALLAVQQLVQGDTARAAELSARAVELAPTAATPLLARSHVQQAQTALDAALNDATAAARLAPDSGLVRARLAELYLMHGRSRDARQAADAAMSRSDTALAHIVLGFAALAGNEARAAEAAFERALERDSESPLAHLGRGLALIRTNRLADGRAELEIAAAQDPANAITRAYLARAFGEEGRDPLAAKHLDIAKELDPEDPTPWLYDAIRKQLANRPVEALKDLERSIALNDNRAPFRSRLLLDRDVATRGASLGRIYQDLGFERLGLTEAARSLAADPTSEAGHRLLSELYVGEPRQELARASELLQAQLLQPVGRRPYQPSLALTDLGIVASTGPTRVTFNEYGPLFDREGVRMFGTGVIGTDETYGDEVALTGHFGKVALGLGQFHYETDGYRPNNQLEHDVLGAFAQVEPNDWLSLQAEVRRRETRAGDRTFVFDPKDFIGSLDERLNETLARIGARFEFGNGATLLLSGVYADRNGNGEFLEPTGFGFDFGLRENVNETIAQGELRLDYPIGRGHLTAGAGVYDIARDRLLKSSPCPGCDERVLDFDTKGASLYAYYHRQFGSNLTGTLGVGLASFDETVTDRVELLPKLGVVWQATPWLRLRSAAFRSLPPAPSVDQTIEPTHVAGFSQLFDDFAGTATSFVGVAADLAVTPDFKIVLEGTRRQSSPKFFEISGPKLDHEWIDAAETALRLNLYATPTNRLALAAGVTFEHFDQAESTAADSPSELRTWSVPLRLRWFAPNGLFVDGGMTFLRQEVERGPGTIGAIGAERAVLLDLGVGYRFPNRRGIIAVEMRNLLDERYGYQDTSFLQVRPLDPSLNPRFAPSRTILGRLTLNF